MGREMQVSNVNNTNNNIPLGVSKQGNLVYFAVSIPHAKECKLLLYKYGCKTVKEIVTLTQKDRIGSVFITKILWNEFHFDSYLYEAMGKTFVDPYAKRIIGREVYGNVLSPKEKELVRGAFDFDEFDWEGDLKPEISYSNLILYKLHVRGFTKDASSKVKHHGTYLGIIEKIPYLKELGVNALLMMPCVEFSEIIESSIHTPSYVEKPRNLSYNEVFLDHLIEDSPKINYWGYTTEYQYFTPKTSYAFQTAQSNTEFKLMVRELHKHGIEVLMEMHFIRGTTLQLIQDCLRFWSMEYHIDGFRFSNELGLENFLASDPYLVRTKLLNHSWNTEMIYERDIIPNYKVLADYNDSFLIDIRRFLKGDEDQLSKFAEHFRCSYEKKTFIHYITEHNGFTLMDLYSYDVKHNEDNGENNLDGTDYNYSWNCGVEGKTKKKKISELRTRIRKNALTVLILSQGVPMLYAGDEFGNTQNGNNNAYCMDSSLSWINWKDERNRDSLFTFTKELIYLKKKHKILRMDQGFLGMDCFACGYPDISFHGTKAWRPEYFNYSRTLGIFLYGNYAKIDENVFDDSFYLAFNMHWEIHRFDLPDLPRGYEWRIHLVTDDNLDMNFMDEDDNKMLTQEVTTQKVITQKPTKQNTKEQNIKEQNITKQNIIKQNLTVQNTASQNVAGQIITNQNVITRKVKNLVQKQYIDLSPRSIVIFKSHNKVLN